MSLGGPGDRRLLAAVLAGLTIAAGLYLLSGINTRDEAWFLQVVTRVAGGDVLYRDVFFGATPLSVWLAWPLVALFGPQLAWVKLTVLASFAASLVLAAWIVRRLGGSVAAALLVALSLFVFATPQRGSLYQPLATTCLLATLAAALAWSEQGERQRLAIAAAGAAAGLAFAAKQNVGLYALAALALVIALAGAGRRLRSAGLAAAGFAAAAVLPLVPVLATGGFGAFVDYGFTNKGSYAELGAVSYPTGFREAAGETRGLLAAGDVLQAVPSVYNAALYLLVPAVLALVALARARSAGVERRRVEVVGIFALAATAAIFPRADAVHVAVVAPILVVAGWYGTHVLLGPPRRRRAALVAAALVAPGVLVLAAWPAIQAADGARPSDLAFARGVLLEPEREERMRRTAAALEEAGAEGSVFLATPMAGFYYLLSGVENPTPYDFPLATAFGRTGEDELVERIRSGGLDTVCLGIRRTDRLTPWRLVHAVKTTMEPGGRTAVCRLYRAQ